MRKVQIISNNTHINNENGKGVIISSLSSPRSLDEFDVNIVDLSYDGLWKNKGKQNNTINCAADLKSIREMIERSELSTIVFVFPQNDLFEYDYGYNGNAKRYREKCFFKDMLDKVCLKILPLVIPAEIKGRYLSYENTITSIGERHYDAAFYFTLFSDNAITTSNTSEKNTTVKLNERLLLTTLNIMDSAENASTFVESVVFGRKNKQPPEWINSIIFNDDEEQMRIILDNNEVIRKADEKIEEAEKRLEENSIYKSILYTNGEELADVVRDIMSQLTNESLDNFADEKKEDFLIRSKTYTLIGEIKGVTSNAKRGNVTQVEQHYYDYLDNLEEADMDIKGAIKQLLIINPQRNKPLDEREPINQVVIDTAKRNGCLIIETKTLLSVYDRFRRGELSNDEFVKMMLENDGLLVV